MSSSASYFLPAHVDGATSTAGTSRLPPGPRLDVYLFHGPDGGDITFTNGEPVLADGLETAAYLSLFGGNAEDTGLPGGLSQQWWGNCEEPVPERWLRSETQYLLATLIPNTGNLGRIESAANNDLAWLVSSGIASAVSAVASMPARNRIGLAITVLLTSAETYRFDFSRPWGQST
jgi:phage gp46-like protein